MPVETIICTQCSKRELRSKVCIGNGSKLWDKWRKSSTISIFFFWGEKNVPHNWCSPRRAVYICTPSSEKYWASSHTQVPLLLFTPARAWWVATTCAFARAPCIIRHARAHTRAHGVQCCIQGTTLCICIQMCWCDLDQISRLLLLMVGRDEDETTCTLEQK